MYYDDVNSVRKYYNGNFLGICRSGTLRAHNQRCNMTNGEYIRPDTTTAHFGLQVYDVDNTV